MRGRVLIGTLLALATGCSAIVEGEVGDLRPDLAAKRDVTIELRDFVAHVGQSITIQLVENFDLLETPPDRRPLVSAQAIIDPAPSDCLDVRLRRGAPFLSGRVDFYADVTGNGVVDRPEDGDHSWRELLDEDGRLTFVHNTGFEDLTIDPGQLTLSPFEVNITGASAHDGATVTVMLVGSDLVDPIENIRRPTVPALYVTQVADGAIAFTMPGAADPGTSYDVEIRIGDRALDCTIEEQRTPTTPGTPLLVEGDLASLSCTPGESPDCVGLEEGCDEGDDESCEELAWQCAFVDCGR